jgi:hypothetical protein
VVCRKEFLETFAAATFVHAKFPDSKRMADLAAGHGLLAWFLLALDYYDNNDHSSHYDDGNNTASHYSTTANANTTFTKANHRYRPRTVICVDRRMPRSADAIASAMLERFPELDGRWSYVQSDLSAVVPHPSCVLTSVHACGTLSDTLIDMSIATGAPLAIVPCCQTVRHGYRPHLLSGMHAAEVAVLVEARKKTQKHAKHEAVADVVDDVRCRTLRNAGYDVEEILLPEAFTARNRLILAEPSSTASSSATPIMDDSSRVGVPFTDDNRPFFQRQPEGGLIPPQSLIRVPLADDPESILHCHTVSQRARAATSSRPEQIAPRAVSLTLAMSIWLVGGITGETGSCDSPSDLVTAETLQALATQCCGEEIETEAAAIQCTVEPFGEVNVQSTTGRRSQLFKFKYIKSDGTTIRGASRTAAKTIHGMLREKIIDKFGDLVR